MTVATLTARLERQLDSLNTTDGARLGSVSPDSIDLTDLTADLATALHGAFWSYMLQAELEDALDTALLRAAISQTPTLTGRGLVSAA
jgi:hypothetical protein